MSQCSLDLIWNCASHPAPELTIETLKSLPNGDSDIFLELELLIPGRISNCVSCEVCHTHIEEVFQIESPSGSARHCMVCEHNGLMEVPRERLLRWNIDYKPIVQTTVDALKCRGRTQEIVKGHLWDLGFSSLPGISRPVYVLRNIDMLYDNLPISGQSPLLFIFGYSSGEFLKTFDKGDIFELRNLLFLKNGAFDLEFLRNAVRDTAAIQTKDAPNIFCYSGDSYSVCYNRGKMFALSTVDVGAGYIHKLLSRPGQAVSVAEIVLGAEIDIQDTALSDSGDIADRKAVNEYRTQARELLEEITEARANGDAGKIEIIQEELFQLEKAINESRGLKNRPRKAQSGRERIRKAFYSAYLRARKKIEESDPDLSEHLKQTISGGMNPVYRPSSEIVWLT